MIVQAVGLGAMTQMSPPQIMPQEPIAIYKDYLTPELAFGYLEQEGEVSKVPEILRKIAHCESGNRQFDDNGNVIRGRENPKDIGTYQINLFYHQEVAEKLGYDLFTEEGNKGYAIWLYNKQGTNPWFWSKKCWNK